MNYYQQLLESYSLLKKRQLRILLEALKPYSAIVQSNPNLEQPIATEMQGLTGLGNEGDEPQLELMKKVLQVQSKQVGVSAERPEGSTINYYTAQGDSGPIQIIGARGGFDRQGWKILQGQIARRLEAQNPDLQNPYKSSGRNIEQDPIISDTARSEEERLHTASVAREIKIMSETTIPNLLAAGFAGDVGRITKEDSDVPGWVKDPKNHLDSYSPQSLWSKVNNEKVTEIAKVIEQEGGDFKGEQATWEDKHEGVTTMHEFAKKCLKLQQVLNGDDAAFTDNDARWVHTNVIIDSTNNKVRYNRGEIDAYGISFDHTTTKRSKQKETMSVGLARIYNKKIKDWVDETNKKFPKEEHIMLEQYEVPEKKLTPEQLKSANWCSNFRGTEAEHIVGFVPQILDISQMLLDYGDKDKRTVDSKGLRDEIERKKDIMAQEMAKLFGESEGVLAEAFKLKDWDKKGEILSDEYSEGILQTVDALKKLGKNEKEIVKKIFKRIVSSELAFFQTVKSDFVFQGGLNTGPSEKADVYVTKLDKTDYLRALEELGIKNKGKQERILKANTKTLRELLIIESGNKIEGLEGDKLNSALQKLLESKKLYKHLTTSYDLDREVYTIPLSLKTYITETDTRLGQTRSMRDTLGTLLNPNDNKWYKKGQDKDRVVSFIEQNEKSLGIGSKNGPSREAYKSMIKKFESISQIGDMIKGSERIKGLGATQVARVVQDLIRQNNAAPSLSDKFLLDYLNKNYERDKEDGREAVRLASFVERLLFQKSEENILASSDDERKLAYRGMLASISMYTGMSADSTFAMEMDLLGGKSKLYNQDDCIKKQAIEMMNGTLPLRRTEVSNDWGNMSLKFERKGNSSVFGLKTKGCENIFKRKVNEDVLQEFLHAQAMLFEKLLV